MTTAPISIDISGMTCAACSQRIERVLNRLPGIEQVIVDLARDRAVITPKADASAADIAAAAVAAINGAGYQAFPRGGSLAERRSNRAKRDAALAAESRMLKLRAFVAMTT